MGTDTAVADDTEQAEGDVEPPFWTRRVYLLAAVLFLLRSPGLLDFETTAGLVGGLFGLTISVLALAGLLKAFYIVAKRSVVAVWAWS